MEIIRDKCRALKITVDGISSPEKKHEEILLEQKAIEDELKGETLLKTIKVPTNLANLSSRLPRSNYEKTRHSE